MCCQLKKQLLFQNNINLKKKKKTAELTYKKKLQCFDDTPYTYQNKQTNSKVISFTRFKKKNSGTFLTQNMSMF